MIDREKVIDFIRSCISEADCKVCPEGIMCGDCIGTIARNWMDAQEKIPEIIARNLVAWDTSKDKRTGLLPEVYLRNLSLYKDLTGEEYTFRRACERFNIGD